MGGNSIGNVATLVLGAIIAAGSGQDWMAGGTRDGVVLSFRDEPRLDAREVRAIAEMPHPADRVLAIACDFTQQLDPDVKEARIISGDLDTRYSIYLRYASRYVVVAPRDVVIDVRRERNGCSWSEQQDAAPPRDGAVRMPLLRGSWLAEPLGASRSRLTYQIAVKPGGRIPGWLVRRGAVGAMPRVFEQVTRCLSSAATNGGRCAAE